MFKFIPWFFIYLFEYSHYKAFLKAFKKRNPKGYKAAEKSDAERGIMPYKNRFDYAYRHAKMSYEYWKGK